MDRSLILAVSHPTRNPDSRLIDPASDRTAMPRRGCRLRSSSSPASACRIWIVFVVPPVWDGTVSTAVSRCALIGNQLNRFTVVRRINSSTTANLATAISSRFHRHASASFRRQIGDVDAGLLVDRRRVVAYLIRHDVRLAVVRSVNQSRDDSGEYMSWLVLTVVYVLVASTVLFSYWLSHRPCGKLNSRGTGISSCAVRTSNLSTKLNLTRIRMDGQVRAGVTRAKPLW